MVQITDTARDKIQEVLDQNAGKYLRIFVDGAGWGGPRMGMALDEPEDNEQSVSVNGIDVLIADFAQPFVDGTTIDYVRQPQGEGFIITGAGGGCWYNPGLIYTHGKRHWQTLTTYFFSMD